MNRLIITILFLPIFANATEDMENYKDEIRWGFSGFIQSFQSKNWSRISEYETKATKCGFGPKEEGIGCIRNAIIRSETCVTDMLFSLKQGCKFSRNKNIISCTSPPQWHDESIIILGARASFEFNMKNKKISVNQFICGGD